MLSSSQQRPAQRFDLGGTMSGKQLSRLAYEQTKSSHEAVRQEVYDFIVSRGDKGASADEVSAALGCDKDRTSPRLTELSQMHAIRDSGQRRKTRAGCLAAVYVATATPRHRLEPRKPVGGYGLLEIFDSVLGLNAHVTTDAGREELYGPRRWWPERDGHQPVSAEELFS
jgi:hypothetical protein